MSLTGRLPLLRLFADLPGWFRRRQTRRAQHVALSALLRAPAHRLADIGIDTVDVGEAYESASRGEPRPD
jgi:uncharacterized protein YjiS (DUF1127 family)